MIDYTLKNPFSFDAKGTETEVLVLRIKPPTAKVANLCATLHVEFNKCLISSQEDIMKDMTPEKLSALREELSKIEKDNEEGISEKDVTQILMSGQADLPSMLETLKRIFIASDQVKFEDGIDLKFTSAVYEEIPYNELNKMLAFYISNFIEASA